MIFARWELVENQTMLLSQILLYANARLEWFEEDIALTEAKVLNLCLLRFQFSRVISYLVSLFRLFVGIGYQVVG